MTHFTCLSLWLFAFSFYFGVSECYFSIPLRIYPGRFNISRDGAGSTPLRIVAVKPDGDGLSLASDPAGTVSFLDMVNNLQGDSGRGYYIEMSLGTPGQKVQLMTLNVSAFNSCVEMCSRAQVSCSWCTVYAD